MFYKLHLTNRKIPFLEKNNLVFEIIERGEDLTLINIRVNSAADVLLLLHAGEEASLDLFTKNYK